MTPGLCAAALIEGRTMPVADDPGVSNGAVYGGSELTIRTAPAFTRAARERLRARPRRLFLNLADVKVVDVVGLGAILTATRLGTEQGVPVAILPGSAVYHACLEAHLLDGLPFVEERRAHPRLEAVPEEPGRDGREVPVVARTVEFILRAPGWDDLEWFERWSHEPHLDVLVGSELLYRCRHLGPYHPEFAASVLHHPTCLTLLVQGQATSAPAGFVRLYGIHLGQRFAFLETAIVSPIALRRGWGVAGSRVLSFYAQDVLGIQRIEAKVYDFNRQSINALKRNGFTQEGVLRQAAIRGGDRCDILVFAILDAAIRDQRARERIPYVFSLTDADHT